MTSHRLLILWALMPSTLFAVTFIINLPTQAHGHEGRHNPYHAPLGALINMPSKTHGFSGFSPNQSQTQTPPAVQSLLLSKIYNLISNTASNLFAAVQTTTSFSVTSDYGIDELPEKIGLPKPTTEKHSKRSVEAEENYQCDGYNSNSGYIVPNEVVAKTNSSFEVFCVLNPDEHPNISLTVFKKNCQANTDGLGEKVNNTVIRANINEEIQTKYHLFCCHNNKFVCNIHVTISNPPMDVRDFRCLIYNNRAMNCSWSLPYYNVETSYNLSYQATYSSLYGRSLSRSRSGTCYDHPGFIGESWCYWDGGSRPAFQSYGDLFNFDFNVTNRFGSESFKHQIVRRDFVIPAPAGSVKMEVLGSRLLRVKWGLPPDIMFLQPVLQQIQYIYEGGKCTVGIYKESYDKGMNQEELLEVPFGFTNYSVRVLLRVRPMDLTSPPPLLQEDLTCSWSWDGLPESDALTRPLPDADMEDDLWWSVSDAMSAKTPSEEPQWAPITDVGTFEMGSPGTVVLTWKQLDPLQFGASDFRYCVIQVSGEEPEPVCTTASWLNITVQDPVSSQRFEVYSRNSMGASNSSSSVLVPPFDQAPLAPILAPVMRDSRDVYQLRIHAQDEATTDVTVYWCQDEKLMGPCESTLHWKHVGNASSISLTSDDLGLEGKGDGIRFAVSAQVQRPLQESGDLPGDHENSNHVEWSSGMEWSDCGVIPYSVLHDLQPPEVRLHGSNTDNLGVSWNLKCEDYGAEVVAFEVWYCASNVTHPDNCTDGPLMNVTVDWWEKNRLLENLQEGSIYTVWVRADYAQEDPGDFSDPRIWKIGNPSGSMPTWRIALIASGSAFLLIIIVVIVVSSGRLAWECNEESKRPINLPAGLLNQSIKPTLEDGQKPTDRSINNSGGKSSINRTPVNAGDPHEHSSDEVGIHRDGHRLSIGLTDPSLTDLESRTVSGTGSTSGSLDVESSESKVNPGYEKPIILSLPVGYIRVKASNPGNSEMGSTRSNDDATTGDFTSGSYVTTGSHASTEGHGQSLGERHTPESSFTADVVNETVNTAVKTKGNGKVGINLGKTDGMKFGGYVSTEHGSLIVAQTSASRKEDSGIPGATRLPTEANSHQEAPAASNGYVLHGSVALGDKAERGTIAMVEFPKGSNGYVSQEQGFVTLAETVTNQMEERSTPGKTEIPTIAKSNQKEPVASNGYVQHGSFIPGEGKAKSSIAKVEFPDASNGYVSHNQSFKIVSANSANDTEESGKLGESGIPDNTDSEQCAPTISHGYVQHGSFALKDGVIMNTSAKGKLPNRSNDHFSQDQSLLTVSKTATNTTGRGGTPGEAGVPDDTELEQCAPAVSHDYVQHGSFVLKDGAVRSESAKGKLSGESSGYISQNQSFLAVSGTAAETSGECDKPEVAGAPDGTDAEQCTPTVSNGYVQHGSFAAQDETASGVGPKGKFPNESNDHVSQDQSFLAMSETAANAKEDSDTPGEAGVSDGTDSEQCLPTISHGYVQHGAFASRDEAAGNSIVTVEFSIGSNGYVSQDQGIVSVAETDAIRTRDSGASGDAGVPTDANSSQYAPAISHGYVQYGSFVPGDGTEGSIAAREEFSERDNGSMSQD